ncbi:MarR family winged helix-turn-helix transcriptional regulator [Rhodococcus sp. OK302]|uniref:MarR family winged helix-turn-helix transcriptional regulator n=1 Tax=Rhodococcus sp. OK302 TaxID=1882769 RepID=UPI000B93EAEA|nr:MarR family transcriptional regulator [Rhodococcus sp. OK302]OYD67157.1 DNA-binding MarR family transcriptional regulator [Rhodococcus sp. OK302]
MVTPETAESVIHSLRALVRRHREIAWAGSHGQTRGALPEAMGALLSLMSADEVSRTTELAAKLRITASTLSRHAAQAEDAGYLQRQADPNDGRASLLSLTPSGKQALAVHRRAHTQRLLTHLHDWTEEEAAELARSLERLRRSTCENATTLR